MSSRILFYIGTILAANTSFATADDYMNGWFAECKKDTMTDKVQCTVTQSESKVFIFFKANLKPESVCIFSNDFPGRQGALRVDSSKAVETDEHGCAAAEPMFSEMKKGTKIKTQYYEWPYDYPQNASGTLEGLKEALAQLPKLRASPTIE